MKNLVVKTLRKEKNYVVLDIFSKVPEKKREIVNSELTVVRDEKTGAVSTFVSSKEHKAFLCLHCGKVEYHYNGNGHIYPLCSECANTQEIFYKYMTLDSKGNDYELKEEFKEKVDYA